MVSWTRSHLPPSTRPRVLDLGCGNGHFLFSLASRRGGYAGSDLTGVDYSQGSVDLARLIGAEKGEESDDDDESDDESDGGEPAAEDTKPTEGSAKDVQFEAWDMLGEDGLSGGPWDLVCVLLRRLCALDLGPDVRVLVADVVCRPLRSPARTRVSPAPASRHLRLSKRWPDPLSLHPPERRNVRRHLAFVRAAAATQPPAGRALPAQARAARQSRRLLPHHQLQLHRGGGSRAL